VSQKISVIIPTFNRAKLLKRALSSVVNQSLKPHEIIVIDDGSSDETRSVAKDFLVKYHYQPNSGVSRARNVGVKIASAEMIAFLDSDDEWHKDKLLLQSRFMQENGFEISHTNEVWIRDGMRVNKPKRARKGDEDFYKIASYLTIATSSILMKKSLFESVGGLDESLEVCEDYDFFLRVSKLAKIGYLDKELVYKYSHSKEQLSYKYWGMDRFRIRALMKFSDDERIKKLIVKKAAILRDGAKKRDNEEIYNKYDKIIKSLQNKGEL
jgi:glycosyltransferase involved in cell wall biosynthesis